MRISLSHPLHNAAHVVLPPPGMPGLVRQDLEATDIGFEYTPYFQVNILQACGFLALPKLLWHCPEGQTNPVYNRCI